MLEPWPVRRRQCAADGRRDSAGRFLTPRGGLSSALAARRWPRSSAVAWRRWDAETARLWQSRQWRDCVDETVSADGELLRLNNAHRAAVFSR